VESLDRGRSPSTTVQKPQKPQKPMKTKSNRFLALASISSAILTFSASAATYQWDGSDSNVWTTVGNWAPTANPYNDQNITVGPAPTGVTAAHRLNVNNQAANALVYSAAEGTTNYGGASIRGLAIGSGAAPQGGSGTMNITGGTFSSLNATGTNSQDIIGNGDGNTGTLNISGGFFIGASTGTSMNLGGLNTSGRVSNLSISGSGTARLTSLILNGTTINVNLDGGTLELNGFTNTAISLAAKIRLNSGTLKARQTNASFIAANALLETLVQSGGAVIDTNTFDITIAEPLLEDAGSPGGGITKNSTGLLTLTQPSTTTGPVDVNAGGLALKAGATSWSPSSFSHSGDKLNFDLGVYNPTNPTVINTGALTVDSAVTVNVTGSSFQVGHIPLINYTSKSITGSLTLNTATLPAGVLATLVDDNAGQIYLDVTQAATIFTWSGASATPGTGDWDTSSLNWNSSTTPYSTATTQLANFPDITTGGTVNITSAFSPLVATISNATGNPYTFSGSGKITGATVINKSNTGIATFASSTNDYTGAVTVSGGALIKEAADSTTGNITVTEDNISFVLKGGVTDGAGQTLNIAGRGITSGSYFYGGSAVQRGALQAQNGNNTWNGNVVLTSTSETRIGVQDGASLTIGGNITESVAGVAPTLRAGGAGDNIKFNGTCSWTGDTFMFSNGGSIVLGGNDRLPTGTRIVFTGSATVLDLNGYNQQVRGVTSFNPTITNEGANPSVLTLSPLLSESIAFFGTIKDGATDSISLVKSGDGTIELQSNNTYSGTTDVNSGTLLVNTPGVLDAASVVTVNGGTLGGTGTINGPVSVSALGTLAPGNPATLAASTDDLNVESADLSAGGTLAIQINDAAPIKADQLAVTNNLDVTNAKLVISTTGAPSEASYVIATASSITGTIAPANVTGLPSGYTLVQDGTQIRLDQISGSPYETWGTPYSLTAGSEGGDLDNDGLTNFEEFAFGLIPNSGSSVNPITAPLGTNGQFTYQRLNGSGLTYSVWTSPDLVSWNEDTTAGEIVTTGTPNDSVQVTLTGPLPTGTLFVRVKAQ
jgi:autotransporter-associated beta strand protein